MSYWFTTSSLYFTLRLYFEAFHGQACRNCYVSTHPLMEFSSASETSHRALRLFSRSSHGILFPMTSSRTPGSLTPGLPHPVRSALRFHYLPAVSFLERLPALFHAGSVFGIHPFRALSLLSSRNTFRNPCAFLTLPCLKLPRNALCYFLRTKVLLQET